jgi:putative addiction module antidote
MTTKLKVRKVSRSTLGVTLPKDLVAELGLAEGDELYVVRTPDGVELTRLDPDFEEALEISRRVIRKYPNAMKKLAEG